MSIIKINKLRDLSEKQVEGDFIYPIKTTFKLAGLKSKIYNGNIEWLDTGILYDDVQSTAKFTTYTKEDAEVLEEGLASANYLNFIDVDDSFLMSPLFKWDEGAQINVIDYKLDINRDLFSTINNYELTYTTNEQVYKVFDYNAEDIKCFEYNVWNLNGIGLPLSKNNFKTVKFPKSGGGLMKHEGSYNLRRFRAGYADGNSQIDNTAVDINITVDLATTKHLLYMFTHNRFNEMVCNGNLAVVFGNYNLSKGQIYNTKLADEKITVSYKNYNLYDIKFKLQMVV